ncbi:MAG: bifunctional demethylmenaquinone methyltransferase/2-methoxy-6-polyprenyl-1,4-benzoquinol methylase UbiE [Phycisphaerales bacterium]
MLPPTHPGPASSSADTPAPAWTSRDLAANPHAQGDKPERVQRMFAAIARRYDLNNRVHSLWLDQSWRRFAVRRAAPTPTDHALDVACGTGDLTQALARGGAARVTGLDFTQEMLDFAAIKHARLAPGLRERITYIRGDAQALPFPDASFDIVTIAFGIRNVADPARAMGEFRRVLRPGGRLVILEFGSPRLAPVRWFNDLYCKRIMPVTATLISRDRSGAYKYLPKSVESFMSRDDMTSLMRRHHFADVTSASLSIGICWCYRGVASV